MQNADLKTEWLSTELKGLASAIVSLDGEKIKKAGSKYERFRAILAKEADVSVNPWENPAVRFGAALALSRLAEIAHQTIVNPGILVEVIRWAGNNEKKRILLALANSPLGEKRLTELVTLTAINRTNLQPQLQSLIEKGLVNSEPVDVKGRRRVYSLGPCGWAIVGLIQAWTGEKLALPDIQKLLIAEVSQKELAERLEIEFARNKMDIPSLAKKMAEITIQVSDNKEHASHFLKALKKTLENQYRIDSNSVEIFFVEFEKQIGPEEYEYVRKFLPSPTPGRCLVAKSRRKAVA